MDDVAYYASIAALLAVVLLLQRRLLNRRRSPPLPPGPSGLPVVGCAHLLVNKLAHRTLADLAAVHGPLMYFFVGQVPIAVVSSPEIAKEVLKTHDANFATRPKLLVGELVGYNWADILFAPSGDYWRKLRRLCNSEILSPKRIMSFRHIRDQEVFSRVQEVRAAAVAKMPVNLSVLFHSLTNSIIARAAFGKKRPEAAEFMAAVKRGVGLSSGFTVPDLFPALTPLLSAVTGMRRTLQEIYDTLDPILEKIIDERQARRSSVADAEDENLVDVFLSLQDLKEDHFGFPVTRSTIKAVILDMFAGGTGTSGSAMEWAMSELLKNPRVMTKLQTEVREGLKGPAKRGGVIGEADLQAADLKYLKCVIKEALRLHPPAPLLVPRESIADCEVAGFLVPAKTRVVVNIWAIGQDPKHWGEDAAEFRPERFAGGGVDFMGTNFEYTPFGSGRRMCPGFNYGLASMELALAQLLFYFDWALPAEVTEVDMDEAPGLGVRRRTPLMACATPSVVV